MSSSCCRRPASFERGEHPNLAGDTYARNRARPSSVNCSRESVDHNVQLLVVVLINRYSTGPPRGPRSSNQSQCHIRIRPACDLR